MQISKEIKYYALPRLIYILIPVFLEIVYPIFVAALILPIIILHNNHIPTELSWAEWVSEWASERHIHVFDMAFRDQKKNQLRILLLSRRVYKFSQVLIFFLLHSEHTYKVAKHKYMEDEAGSEYKFIFI